MQRLRVGKIWKQEIWVKRLHRPRNDFVARFMGLLRIKFLLRQENMGLLVNTNVDGRDLFDCKIN